MYSAGRFIYPHGEAVYLGREPAVLAISSKWRSLSSSGLDRFHCARAILVRGDVESQYRSHL